MAKRKTKIGYVCATDFDYHLGVDRMPVMIYRSLKIIKEVRECIEECGVYEISMEIKKIPMKIKF